MSFYSKDLYRTVAKDWSTGLCLLYLLSLVALCWIPGIIRLDTDMKYYVDVSAPKYIAQMPEIAIAKGKASITEEQPFVIKDPDNGDPFMIIDTKGGTKSLEKSKAIVLLTETQLILKENDQERPVLTFSDLGEFTMTKAVMYDGLEVFRDWFAIIAYPIAVIFAFIFRVLQALIYSVVGHLFSRVIHAQLTYKLLLRVCTVAMTPLIIFNTLILFFRVDMPYPFFVNSAIATAYLIFAIRASYSPEPQE